MTMIEELVALAGNWERRAKNAAYTEGMFSAVAEKDTYITAAAELRAVLAKHAR